MPVMRVLYLELAVETVVIVAFAVVLWLLAIAEKQEGADAAGPEWTSFSTKLALSLSSVRLNTDSIFGFKPRPVSSGTEIMVLVIEGWFHWLLLQVAGAIIVSRALLPHRQMPVPKLHF